MENNGKQGNMVEIRVRKAITPHTKIMWVKPANTCDHRIKLLHTYSTIEIKTGCGKLIYNVPKSGEPEDYINSIYPKASLIVYSPEPYADMDILDECWVFTRNEFIQFLMGYTTKTGKHGTMLRFKDYTNKHGKLCTGLSLQEWKTSTPKTEYIWDTLANVPTLGEWLESIGRGRQE